MAVSISSFEDFMAKLDARKSRSDLFAFFLFDDRPSHEAIEKFADNEFTWLDSLAASARLFFFIFLRTDKYEGGIANPGLEIARMFEIRPNQLPGVVLFTVSEDLEVVNDGVFLPLKARLFAEDLDAVEGVFTDLFTLIQDCRERSSSSTELLENLRNAVAGLRRRQQVRPVLEYLGDTALLILKFPAGFIGELQNALARETARRAYGR